MVVAEDLFFLVAVGTAQLTELFAGSSGARSIQGQSDEAAVVEGLVALGLTHGGDRRLPRHRRVEPLGEVTERIVAEAPGNIQGAAGLGTDQRFNPGEGRAAQHTYPSTKPTAGRQPG